MKITTTENGEIQLEEVYNPIVLKTRDGEVMAITMRDTGFELTYQGKWYSAKQCVIEPFDMNEAKPEGKQSDTPDVVGQSEGYHCELYEFSRCESPCARQCENCFWMESKR